jgi:WD40 repeat protein
MPRPEDETDGHWPVLARKTELVSLTVRRAVGDARQILQPASDAWKVCREYVSYLSPPELVALSPDFKWLLVASQVGRVHLWRVGTDTPVCQISIGQSIHAAAVASGGGVVAFASDTGEIIVRDTTIPEWRGQLSPQRYDWLQGPSKSRFTTGRVQRFRRALHLVFNTDGSSLLAAYGESRVLIWDPARETLARWLTSDNQAVGDIARVALSPCGRWVVGGDMLGRLLQWEGTSPEPSLVRGRHAWPVLSVTCSERSPLVLSVGTDGSISLCHIAGPGFERMWLPSLKATSACFLCDDKRIAIGNVLGDVRVWDLESWAVVEVWKAHSAGITSLFGLPEGGLLSVGADGRVLEWKNLR